MKNKRILLLLFFILIIVSGIIINKNFQESKIINNLNNIEDLATKFSLSYHNKMIAYIPYFLNELGDKIVILNLLSGEKKIIETNIYTVDVNFCQSRNILSYLDFDTLNVVFFDNDFNILKQNSTKHTPYLPKISWSNDCSYIAVSDESELKIYETESLKQINIDNVIENLFYPSAKWSPNNKYFVFNNANGNIQILNNESWDLLTSISINYQIYELEFYDNENLLISTEDYLLMINIASKNEIKRIIHDEKRFKKILWSKTNVILVNSSEVNQNLELWDIEKGRMLLEIDESTYHNSFEFFLNDKYLVYLHDKEFQILNLYNLK